MKEASALGTLHREQQFVMSIDASERNPAWDQGEQILVQGIIDAFWEEADGLVLVDYKTDHVKEGQELIDRYQRQMHYYCQALERAYGKKVKEVLRYFKDSQDLLTSNIIRYIVLNAKQHTVRETGGKV